MMISKVLNKIASAGGSIESFSNDNANIGMGQLINFKCRQYEGENMF